MQENLLSEELDAAIDRSVGVWRELTGARVVITGGTGFVGCWLLEMALRANDRLALGMALLVVSRHPAAFIRRCPALANHPAVRLIEADVLQPLPALGDVSHVIHAAAETNAGLTQPTPLAMFDSSVLGTRNMLDAAVKQSASRVLLLSSGAVYGKSAVRTAAISEYDALFPVQADLVGAYAAGKRAAEFAVQAVAAQGGPQAVIARCFSFAGAYLPLDSGYAIGNFLAQAMAGDELSIKGDGTPLRSYLYGSDMAEWLWTLLVRGRSGECYNVGSDQPVSIAALAETVGRVVRGAGRYRVSVARPAGHEPPEWYVPSIDRVGTELGLIPHVSLEGSIRRMWQWYAAF